MPGTTVNRPAGTGDYLFMLFHDAVQIRDRGGLSARPENSLILWTPEDAHEYGAPGGTWHHSWIHCHGSRIRQILRTSGLPTNQVLDADAGDMETMLHVLHDEVTGPAPDPLIAGNLIENWLRRVARGQGRHVDPLPSRLRDLQAWMDQYCHEPLRLADLARRANMSAPHLSAEFRRHLGVSPIEYLIRQRLTHARYLLRDQNIRIADVARRVGYDDVQYFSKLFRRRHGMSPRRYRQTQS